ncbi:MAG: DNA-protecting protein DprA [Nitrospirae bacterium]|nr:MAG: DNA-protecting protein DprA [Nitrospirota bacterium]
MGGPVAGTSSLQSWFRLRAVHGLGDAGLCRLAEAFGSPEAVLQASTESLMAAGSVSFVVAQAIQQVPDRETQDAIDRELELLERLQVSVVSYLDAAYPARLKTIADPPPLLYVSGALDQRDRHAVAIVGARRATAAGRLVTEQLSRDLASAGFTIVSGLARGVDAAAHRGALAAQGRTLAVLGCGIDRTYPPEHQALRQQIEAHGAVLSEFPLGAHPHAYHFPRRNRIISGLSLGVVITEAAVQSGSLITAGLAVEQGREVFAVPGFVRAENSRGPNGLIKQGAKLVETVVDVIDELLPQLDGSFREQMQARGAVQAGDEPQLDEAERKLHDVLSFEPMHIDDLIVRTGLPAADVAGLLLAMELKGAVRQLPGRSYVRL